MRYNSTISLISLAFLSLTRRICRIIVKNKMKQMIETDGKLKNDKVEYR